MDRFHTYYMLSQACVGENIELKSWSLNAQFSIGKTLNTRKENNSSTDLK